MLDYVAMTMKDLDQEALSSDSIRENASSKPSRYRARHAAAVRGGYELIATKPAARRARKGVRNDHAQNDLRKDQCLAPESTGDARMVSVLRS